MQTTFSQDYRSAMLSRFNSHKTFFVQLDHQFMVDKKGIILGHELSNLVASHPSDKLFMGFATKVDEVV